MKKLIFAIAAVAVVAGSMTTVSCKKGENDPFMSFRSRAGRFAGEWSMSAGTSVSTYVDNSSATAATTVTTDTYTAAAKTSVTSYTAGSISVASTDDYTIGAYSFTTDKDGTYTMVTTETQTTSAGILIDVAAQTTDTETVNGLWSFIGKNKGTELKNKEAVAMTPVSSTSASTTDGTTSTGTNSNTGWGSASVMSIDQLKNKEMIFTSDWSATGQTSSMTVTMSMTMTQD
jgi:hypothetical protein